jgi:hypothetical protein
MMRKESAKELNGWASVEDVDLPSHISFSFKFSRSRNICWRIKEKEIKFLSLCDYLARPRKEM